MLRVTKVSLNYSLTLPGGSAKNSEVEAVSKKLPSIRSKRKVIVDLLCLCIEQSALARVLSVATVRYVIESALGEIYREGEFQLEPLWQILEREPGVSARDAAAPLLAFKALELDAGLKVQLPGAVASFTAEERELLRGTVDIPRERMARLIEELHGRGPLGALPDVTGRHSRLPPSARPAKPAPSSAPILAAVVVLALGLASLAYLLAR